MLRRLTLGLVGVNCIGRKACSCLVALDCAAFNALDWFTLAMFLLTIPIVDVVLRTVLTLGATVLVMMF